MSPTGPGSPCLAPNADEYSIEGSVLNRFVLATKATPALSVLLLAALTACGGGSGTGVSSEATSPAATDSAAAAASSARANDVASIDAGTAAQVAATEVTPSYHMAPVLLDEPVSFQDPAHQQIVGRWLATAAPVHERAWVASAHDPSWIARVATHVLALFGDGRWQAGPVDEILSAPVLERTYGCEWRSVEGAWLPA